MRDAAIKIDRAAFEVADALALSCFAVVGVAVAVGSDVGPLWLWGPILGTLTGAGGGVLRDIVRGVKQGKGTVGALLVDPSIYEDLKRVLGNVERNSVLRALVRYSIRRDEQAPEVKEEANAP